MSSRPDIRLSNVDLPQPLGPTNPTNSPSWILRLHPSRAVTRDAVVLSNTLATSRISMMGSALLSFAITIVPNFQNLPMFRHSLGDNFVIAYFALQAPDLCKPFIFSLNSALGYSHRISHTFFTCQAVWYHFCK